MNIQDFVNAIGEAGERERSNYHLTFGQLIDALKNSDETARISPKITGVGAYRGYYSDIALMTETVGTEPMYTENIHAGQNYKEWDALSFEIKELSENPHELAKQFESMLGKYTDGYKGGCSLVTLKTPLWLADDYGDCSGKSIIAIDKDLKLTIKEVE